MTAVPRRVLVVSAAIGEGHNAAGRALGEAAGRAWPGCQVRWLDTLASMGPGMGPVARRAYVMQVQHTPWMYEFFFSAMWRQRWLLSSTRRGIGSWCGRRMAPAIRTFAPDVIISTYPLGSAGLSWLRQHRQLGMPVGAWVPAFCPHPYWVYRNLDTTFVSHASAVPVAARAEPGARVAVGALPVRDAFTPADRAAARARLGAGEGFVAVVSAGSFGFGSVDRAVSAVLAAGPGVGAIAICGRNERLRVRLESRGEPAGRLRVIGWTDDMPGWITASDVVVTNAGGATALEAVASGCPVIMFEPIAGHGRANAALMTKAGLALSASSPAGLTAAIRRLASDPAVRARLESRLAETAGRREDDLAKLAAMPGRAPPRPVPVAAQDALFLHVQTERRPQQVGAVVLVNGEGVDLAGLRSSVAARAAQIPQLRRRLLPAHRRWRRARWLTEDAVDVHAAIKEVTVGADDTPASLDQIVGHYFAAPLDPRDTPWQLLLVHGGPGEPSAVVVKVHHALGDGYYLISALSGLFDAERKQPLRRAGSRSPAAWAGAMLTMPRHALRIARGLLGMSLAGPAHQTSISGAATGRRREFATVSLDSRTVAVTARRLGASVTDLVLALVAEALGRRMAGAGKPAAGHSVRAMVPSTLRTTRRGQPRREAGGKTAGAATATGRAWPGNRTTGILLDLPTGPMPLPQRVAAIRTVRQARLSRGDAVAAAFVLDSMKLMPPPLQRVFARATFTSNRFNLIVSVFPGIRRTRHLLGAEVTAVFPVLALADGVGLAVGAMTWGQSLSIGLTADPALVPSPTLLAAEIRTAFTANQPRIPEPAHGRRTP